MTTNSENFVHFTCAKLIKNSAGQKEVKHFPKGGWKGKSKEDYLKMCKETDKVKCVLTGKINGFTVFDFDTEQGYHDTIDKYPYLKNCYTIKTSKGFHIYTKYNPSYKTTTNTNIEIDVRNDDALAFGAGTKTEFGTEYRVYHDGSLEIEAPKELYKLINPDYEKKKFIVKNGSIAWEGKPIVRVKETESKYEELSEENKNRSWDLDYWLGTDRWCSPDGPPEINNCVTVEIPGSADGRMRLYWDGNKWTKNKFKEPEPPKEEGTLNVAIINNISVKYLTDFSDWCRIVWAMRKIGCAKEFAIKISKKASNYSDEGFDKVWHSGKTDSVGIGTLKWYSRKSDEFKHFEIIAQHDNFPKCLKESTDLVMAQTIVNLIEDDIIFQQEEVYIWYDNRWILDNKGHVVKKVAERALSVYFHQLNDIYSKKMIASEPESDEYNMWLDKMKVVKNLITKIHTVSCMKNYFEMIQQELSGSAEVIEFDMKAYLFCFNNKCYDLELKEWVEPSKYDYILTKTGHDYVKPSQEQKDKIKKLMEEVFPDPEIRKCYMSVLHQGMIGQTTEKFVLANGRGRNGKGMTNELFMSLVGNYGYDMNISTLTEKLKGGSNPEIANLDKKRFIIATEPADSAMLNLGNIKKITGGNEINARLNYSNKTKTVLMCTTVLEANKKPNIDGRIDESAVGRFMDIPFVAYYSDDPKEYDNEDLEHVYKKDTSLKTPTFKEDHRCALFHYLIEYPDIDEIYQPEVIRQRTKAYLDESDEFSNWFFDNYEKTEDLKEDIVKVRDVYNKYKEGDVYANMTKKQKRMLNDKNFKDMMQGHMNFRMYYKERYQVSVGKEKINYKHVLIGYKLKDQEDEIEEEPEC